jgi:hypothetical protein
MITCGQPDLIPGFAAELALPDPSEDTSTVTKGVFFGESAVDVC